MSKDIWHTTDETPKPWVSIAFYVDGYLYDGYYESLFNQYGIFGADKVEKWCYVKELSSYIPALETELERTRKALDVANAVIMNYAKEKLEKKESAFVHNKIEFPEYNDNLLEEFDKQFFENGQDDDLTETALEQKDSK